ncbi:MULTISPECIES: hypothetical protein [unclassified Actinoplanes]|uniref:hypothetical protein n=1 Tax=unclassified Actinoplanes TaxID=2626549 RepID=UPI0002D91C41|nr:MULTISPECIES: hypothetical protein [unclassified Actinoplanes]
MSCIIIGFIGGWPPYVAAAAWALTGVTLSGVRFHTPAIWATAAVGLLAVALTTQRSIKSGHRPGT